MREAALSVETWDREAPTFAIVDFFNFESEAIPVLEGRMPQYDFASSYRVVVDDFLLKFLATESLVVELCKVQGADFELLGRCQVPLYKLLQSRPTIKLPVEPLMSTRDGQQIGSANLEIRMAKPIDQLFALYLEQHPEERLRIDHALARLVGPDGAGALTVHAGVPFIVLVAAQWFLRRVGSFTVDAIRACEDDIERRLDHADKTVKRAAAQSSSLLVSVLDWPSLKDHLNFLGDLSIHCQRPSFSRSWAPTQ